jgi:hypothetical protein
MAAYDWIRGAMRITNIPPTLLCDRHLIAEHVTCHEFLDLIRKGLIQAWVRAGLIEVHNLDRRHMALAQEMEARTFFHWNIDLDFANAPELPEAGEIDTAHNLALMAETCLECRARIEAAPKPVEVVGAPRARGRTVKANQREAQGWA